MGEKLGGKGKVAILGVKKGSVSTDEREEGFRETIKKEFPGITLVPIIFYGEANAAKSLSVAEDVLTSHSDLTGLFASNESSTVGAVRAIRQRNLAGKVTLVGFDATPTWSRTSAKARSIRSCSKTPSRWATRESRPSSTRSAANSPNVASTRASSC